MNFTNQLYDIKNSYIQLERRVGSVLYETIEPDKRNEVAILIMHSDADYHAFIAAPELAKRGFTVLAANVNQSKEPMEDKLLDVKKAVEYLKKISRIKKIILLGHSGGATLMSAYQSVAENGSSVFGDDSKIIKLQEIEELPKADGLLFLDSNWGNGVMTLLSLDPAITCEDNSLNLNPEFDLFSTENGYNPNGSNYTQNFVVHYQKAQEKRNEKIINTALERLQALNEHKGKFADDEPFIVPGGAQIAPNNKLFPQDIHYLAHSKKAWPLIRSDGTILEQVIYCLRPPKFGRSFTRMNKMATEVSTVRTYLTNACVRTDNFSYDEEGIYGIDWNSSYCCTPGNVMYVSAPMLIMGMTGGYEYLASEIIYENAKSKDKTIAFVEGAGHNFEPVKETEKIPGEYGDTVKNCFDYVAKWLCEKFVTE